LEFTKVPSNAGHGGAISFRFNGSAADCASRIIEDSQGRISVYAASGAPGILATGAVLVKTPMTARVRTLGLCRHRRRGRKLGASAGRGYRRRRKRYGASGEQVVLY
jgi:hypothetical protein